MQAGGIKVNCKKPIVFSLALLSLTLVICGQTLTITAPNGGESWLIGDPVSITWTATGISGNARINLITTSGVVVGTIADSVPVADAVFIWRAGTLVTGPAAPGNNYLIRMRLIGTDSVDNSNAAFSLVARLPNIHIGSMHEIGWDHTFTPRTFSAGDTVTISYHLCNDSDYAAGPFQVGLRVGGAIVARQAHAELVNGADGTGSFTWTAVCGQAIAIVADCDGEVVENNEGDNVMTDPGLACSQVDLYFFKELRCSSGSPRAKAGLRYEFSAQVDALTARADNVRVRGGVVGGPVLYDHTFAAMAGDGGIEPVAFIWEVPAGEHRVYFEIDPDHTVVESNERNNRQELAITGVASTPLTEHYDLRISIDRARSFGTRLRDISLPAGRALTIYGEVRGATGAIRDFKVSGTVRGGTPVRFAKVYEQDFNDPGMLVVPFSFTWTPVSPGEYTITVKAELGPHAIAAGVTDGNPANNAASLTANVIRALIKR